MYVLPATAIKIIKIMMRQYIWLMAGAWPENTTENAASSRCTSWLILPGSMLSDRPVCAVCYHAACSTGAGQARHHHKQHQHQRQGQQQGLYRRAGSAL
jgi:hypothetical protein